MTKKAAVVDVALVHDAIVDVWQTIGYDVLEASGGRVSNTEAVECCIDANRLTFHAHAPAAEAEIQRAIAAHGYDKVLRALARAIRLA